jgi:hypothetical protein
MSLFMCTACGCVENTACCNYWGRRVDKQPLLCSECDPDIHKWHGRFTKRSALGMLKDDEGYLWSKDGIAGLPKHKRIVGEVTEAPTHPPQT